MLLTVFMKDRLRAFVCTVLLYGCPVPCLHADSYDSILLPSQRHCVVSSLRSEIEIFCQEIVSHFPSYCSVPSMFL